MGTVLIAVVLYCLPLNVVRLLYQVPLRIELNIEGGNVKVFAGMVVSVAW